MEQIKLKVKFNKTKSEKFYIFETSTKGVVDYSSGEQVHTIYKDEEIGGFDIADLEKIQAEIQYQNIKGMSPDSKVYWLMYKLGLRPETIDYNKEYELNIEVKYYSEERETIKVHTIQIDNKNHIIISVESFYPYEGWLDFEAKSAIKELYEEHFK